MRKFYKKNPNSKFLEDSCETIIDINWKKIKYNRISFINKALQKFGNIGNYLEIGIDRSECFDSIVTKNKTGVDPNPSSNSTFEGTSDDFFKQNKKFFDVIFIDGKHEFNQCRNDAMNSLKCLNKNGYILFHDFIPRDWLEEHIPQLQANWCGDVWKVSIELSKTKGIDFLVIIADHGVGLLKKKEDNISYHNEYEKLKNLKFKDFLELNKCIDYVDADFAMNYFDENK